MTVEKKLNSVIFIAILSLVFSVIAFAAMTDRVHAQLPSGATGVFGGIITNVKYCNCSHTYRISVLHPLSPRPKIVHYVPGRSIQCEYYNITRTGVWTLGIDRPVTPCLKWVWTIFAHFCVPVIPHPIADIVLTGTSDGSIASLDPLQTFVFNSSPAGSGLLTQVKLFLQALPLPSWLAQFLLPEIPNVLASHNSCPRPPPPQDFPPQPDDPPPPDEDPPSDGGTCDAVTSGPCTEENLEGECSWDGNEASQVCNVESGGIADRASAVDIVDDNGDCGSGSDLPFSSGLFQVNLTVHQIGGLDCPSAFDGKNSNAKIVDCDLYEKCIEAANDPDTNIAKACELYEDRGGNWADWQNTANKCELPTSGSGTDPPIVSSGDTLTQEQAEEQLEAAGFDTRYTTDGGDIYASGNCNDPAVSTCTSLEGINQSTLDEAIALKQACGCQVIITGGTETGHSTTETFSHGDGFKIDIEDTADVNYYFQSSGNCSQTGTRSGDPVYSCTGSTAEYVKESTHWDITVPPEDVLTS